MMFQSATPSQFEQPQDELFPPFPVPRVGPLGWDGHAWAGIAEDREDTTGYLATANAINIGIIIRKPVRR